MLLLAFAHCGGVRAESPAYDWKAWGAATDTLVVSGPGRMALRSAFLVSGSERVLVDGRVLPDSLYDINYQRGLLRIREPLAPGVRVIVSYVRLPFLLSSVYSLRDIEFTELPDSVPARRTSAPAREPLFNPTGDLVFGGFKSISFSVGTNKSTSLDQALRASVEGDLTSSIRVKALLSDDNLPIQPEGNTEELEYLDKVVVELTGPHARAVLGDLTAENRYSSFTPFRRELKGASGEAFTSRHRVGVAAGSGKGVFRTFTFRGSGGTQGPYELLSPGRLSGEVIIAGTERVYFDGELLQRGQNRDYTIDYDRGTVTFTPRRPVTADTEVAVDFEATQEAYDRTSIFANAETASLPGGLSLLAAAARETDDDGRPRSTSLSEEDYAVLEAAGDDPSAAVASGVKFVGAGNGDYVLVAADSTLGVPEHYEFDDSAGVYALSFTDVGAGRGDYVLDAIASDGRAIYRFAGAGKGNYVIGRRLFLPQAHNVVSARLRRPGDRLLVVDAEYNLSEFDANTRSVLDDGDNVGGAGALRLGFQGLPLGVGRGSIAASTSAIDEDFRSLEKTRTSYFYRDWNLENVPLEGREYLHQVTSSFIRAKTLNLEYDLGLIRRDRFEGTKHEGRASLSRLDDQRFTARVFSSAVDGERDERTRRHGTFSLSYGFWRVVPTVTYGTEEYLLSSPSDPDSGLAYDRYLVRLASRRSERLGFALETERRDTRARADTTAGWVDARVDRAYTAVVSSQGSAVVQGEASYTHRVEENRIGGGETDADLARLKGLLHLDRLGLRSNFDYEVSQNRFRAQRKSVVFVGEGKGDYNQQGELVGKGRGDYMLVFLPTLETVPTHNVGLTLYLSWKGTHGAAASQERGVLTWIRRNVSLEQSLSVREETTFDDAYKVYLLFPSALQRDASTLYGLLSLRQDWSLLGGRRDVALTFRYQRDDEEENRFEPVKEDRFFQQQLVRIDRSISPLLGLNLEAAHEDRGRRGKGIPSGTGSTYDVDAWAVSGGWGLRFSAGTTLDGDVAYRRQTDSESGAKEQSLAFRPRVLWRAAKALNVFARYELAHFFGDENETAVRPIIFTGAGTAHRWALTPNLKLNQWISFLATYEGRSERTFVGTRVTEHDLRVETRAYF